MNTDAERGRGRLPELKGTQTEAHLQRALQRDAQMVGLYRYFARIADIEGYPEVARTLLEVADSVSLIVDGHIDFLQRTGDPISRRPLGGTTLNLQALAAAEAADATDVLPDMARTAHAEGFPDIASWFESVAAARAAHNKRCALSEQ